MIPLSDNQIRDTPVKLYLQTISKFIISGLSRHIHLGDVIGASIDHDQLMCFRRAPKAFT